MRVEEDVDITCWQFFKAAISIPAIVFGAGIKYGACPGAVVGVVASITAYASYTNGL